MLTKYLYTIFWKINNKHHNHAQQYESLLCQISSKHKNDSDWSKKLQWLKKQNEWLKQKMTMTKAKKMMVTETKNDSDWSKKFVTEAKNDTDWSKKMMVTETN